MVRQQFVRPPAVAGTWYPGTAAALAREVDEHLASARLPPHLPDDIVALVAPHAGLAFSGPVGAYAYRAVAGTPYEVVILAGPSHYVAFDGVSIWSQGAFDTPLGAVPVDEETARAIEDASPAIRRLPEAHAREHALEMQLPFLQRVLPGVPVVPLLMGVQERRTIEALAGALVRGIAGRRALLVASTDLSHFFDARRAAALDARVIDFVERLDADGLLDELEKYDEHERGRFVACGGGPTAAVIRAASALGARCGRVLHRADSGDVSGHKEEVVGYLGAVLAREEIDP